MSFQSYGWVRTSLTSLQMCRQAADPLRCNQISLGLQNESTQIMAIKYAYEEKM